MLETTEQVREAKFNEIVVQNPDDSFEWARLLWEDSTGRVFLVSSWGAYSHCWTHIGDRTLAQFLAGLDICYMGSKFLGADLRQMDYSATKEACRKAFDEACECGEIKPENVESEREILDDYENDWIDFENWYEQTGIADAYELKKTKTDECWQRFWDRLWQPLIVPILKRA